MPKQYEAMRDKFKADGMDEKAAKTKAARIYNSKHSDKPVTGKSEKRKVSLKIGKRKVEGEY